MGEPMDRAKRVFGSLVKFEEAFPQLEDATIKWTESGSGVHHQCGKESYAYKASVKTAGDLIRCSNPLCGQGGFEISGELQDMVHKKETFREGVRICAGSEGSPKLKRVYRKCVNSIRYRITLTYKNV